ncbi:response regulator [Pelotomaculum propionicicum]|uniref:Stage 0 sporulation protein A homolog n=1 Tax=Pelotomaculum propionicicum TaxID=258475 RepID=A0A4Y7RL73_9FIRM|nr:response regulator [Pelotomaculum propionicicum]NLI13298.1 response regulator [Peptococcaceae bacterium]TEB09067.1 Chemotaxis protein CheY [Pelotomaculum propionicicum]
MKKRIMIVDDSVFARKMLHKILTSHNYEVVGEFESGCAAVSEYKNLNPDLVTMDIIMDGMNGLEALNQILSIDPFAKIIVVSSHNNKDFIELALQAGALYFIVKPYAKDHLLQVVEDVLSVHVR